MGTFIGLTGQFKFCPNAFRIDTYRGCNFGCKYCFANTHSSVMGKEVKMEAVPCDYFKKYFIKAFESDRVYKDLTVELLKHKVPLHCGGMADPFQSREFEDKRTLDLIKLSNKYQYPIIFSTKTAYLPDEYWDYLDPKLHAFQISLCGFSDEFIRKYETNTPLANERIAFMKELRDKGFWVSVRIQPLIEIDEAIEVIKHTNDIVNYTTVEHIKIPTNNFAVRKLLQDIKEKYPFVKPKKSRNYEITTEHKLKNIGKIREVVKTPLGCADNDLHRYSDNRCCCGVDLINENFSNYLKYNTCYFNTGAQQGIYVDKSKIWIPQGSCRGCLNSDCVVEGMYKINEYVDKYIKESPKEYI